MCISLATAAIIGGIMAAGGAVYSAEKQAAAQDKAADKAKQAADRAAQQADWEFNRANSKSPNVGGLADANKITAGSGQSSTMLTGAGGVDPTSLALGKNTLLGQ